ILPKPGKWMNTLKKVMAIPLFLTVAWLLWILLQVRGLEAVLMVVAGGVALGFALRAPKRKKQMAWAVAFAFMVGSMLYVSTRREVEAITVKDDVWIPYSEKVFKDLAGKKVFVNMTADWCLTCKVNENLVFNDPEVKTRLEENGVVL